MEKLDIANSVIAVERLLGRNDITPLQRQILLNYRRHSRAEISGNWPIIFEPGMIVEEPHYILKVKGKMSEVKGLQAVKDFYAGIGSPVLVHKDQEIHLAESSFTSFSWLHHYLTGQQLIEIGEEVANPDGFYVRKYRTMTLWKFEERGRLIGEYGGELGLRENIEVSEENFITPEDARRVLEPLIEPLPEFTPE